LTEKSYGYNSDRIMSLSQERKQDNSPVDNFVRIATLYKIMREVIAGKGIKQIDTNRN
jgi:hypothetical protein